MLRKYSLVLIVIAIAWCASVIVFGEDDLGGGISIEGEALTFFVLEGYDITADFTTYTKGGVIRNSSGEPLYTDSKEAPEESKMKIRLPVYGDKVVECKADLNIQSYEYKILEINLSTKDNINFDITVELLKTCLNEFPQLDQNPPYDIKPPKPEDKEPVGINPKSPTRGPIVNLDKPIKICFHGTIKSLLWGVQPSVADLPWNPIIFIPLCDKEGNRPPCKPETCPDIIEVLGAKWYGEDIRKVTTWFKVILGKEEENGNKADLSDSILSQNQIWSQGQSEPCVPCKPPCPIQCKMIIIHPPKCLNPCQITTWKEVIDISQNKGAKDNEKQ